MAPPRCTYRVQLRPEFGFDAARDLVGYLARLGVSHLYLSPVLQAVPGSAHGYDVVDHSRVSAELGGPQAFARLVEAVRAAGMGVLLDIVPNHMAIDPAERWWWDVLENGRSSIYALYFDVSWEPPEERNRETILLPVLAGHYGRELEAGALRLERDGGRIVLRYQERYFPIAPGTLDGILAGVAGRTGSPEVAELARSAAALPDVVSDSRDARRARHEAKEAVLARLAELAADDAISAEVDREIARLNGDPDDLDALLRRQHYRVAFWRTGAREVDYRRFFDINELIGLRIEDEDVFEAVHERVLGWLRDGSVDGVRVDHVDGLRDPRGYLERLRARSGADTWIVVEKILHHDERLRPSWPVDGTTGYEAIDLITRLFLDPHGEAELTAAHRELTGETRSFEEVARQSKHELMRGSLATDVERTTALLVRVCDRHRRHRDHTRPELRDVVRELAASLAVYRTYASADGASERVAPPARASSTSGVEAARPQAERVEQDEDARWLDGAIGAVRRSRPDIDPELLRFVRSLVLLRVRGDIESEFVMRFQQLTAPVAAKGVEDTAFYRWSRLIALNEVGGDPGRWSAAAAELHRACSDRLRSWPRALVPGSTHDTKRSEDVRARLVLLSEIPDAWREAVARWSLHNERHRTDGMPDRDAEYLFYQTAVGAHPLPVRRALAYMEKAVREAKRGTSWTTPNERYERALADFVRGTLADPVFVADLERFTAPLVEAGRVTSLAQTLLRLTMPGVPDLYQGAELWDLSLVDPDNRRPVDFTLRSRLLDEAGRLAPDEILARMDEGLPKLFVIARALAVRRARAEVFATGAYEPLAIEGPRSAHAVAFARCGTVAVVVPRLVLGLADDWRDTTVRVPDGAWRDRLSGAALTGGVQPLREVLGRFPVALLEREA